MLVPTGFFAQQQGDMDVLGKTFFSSHSIGLQKHPPVLT